MEKDLLLMFPDPHQATAFRSWFNETGLRQFKSSQQHLDIIDEVPEEDMIDESCQIDCYNHKIQILSTSDVEEIEGDEDDDENELDLNEEDENED